MAKIIRLIESDLNRLVKKVIKEYEFEMEEPSSNYEDYQKEFDEIMEKLRISFDKLLNVSRMVGDDESLSPEERDEFDSRLSSALDDIYRILHQDWD